MDDQNRDGWLPFILSKTAPGEIITITARYRGFTKSIRYQVQPGGQQVDVVIPRTGPHSYLLERQTWGADGKWEFGDVVDATTDTQGNIYVLEQAEARVLVFDRNGNYLCQWIGQFFQPNGITVDQAGAVYIADTWNDRIQIFTKEGIFLREFGISGHAEGQLWSPTGVAINRWGSIYVNDAGNSRIQQFSAGGTYLRSIPGNFNDIVMDGDTILATDNINDRVVRLSLPDGRIIGSWGARGQGKGQFQDFAGIAADSQGNVYVADRFNYRMQKFTSTGAWLATWGSQGHGEGQFDNMYGLAVGPTGRVYVVDRSLSGGSRVHVFRPMLYTKPIATITHLQATVLGAEDTLNVRGMGQDSDESSAISAYEWTSDQLPGVILGTKETLSIPASTLRSGSQFITLRVRDSEGEWSDPIKERIYVGPPTDVTWTMLLYLAGDYDDAEQLWVAFNQAIDTLRLRFDNPSVRIAVQVDSLSHAGTLRLILTPGTTTKPPQVQEIPISEQAMDDPASLANFIHWGQTTFPADHYYLSIANHGQGLQGIAWDTTSDRLDDSAQNGSAYLTVGEIKQALNDPSVAPIDILHLDACSMSLLEVAYEVRSHVDILIASQYLGWSYFAYDAYQQVIDPTSTPIDVARSITGLYASRASADHNPFTISALDVTRVDTTIGAVNNLADALITFINKNQDNKTRLKTIWQNSRKFESNGDFINNELDMYVDLLDWAERIRSDVSDSEVQKQAGILSAELKQFIIAESNHAESNSLPADIANGAYIDLAGSNGVSIFYPEQPDTVAFDSYMRNRLFDFTGATRWTAFLGAGVGSPTPIHPLPGPLAPLPVRYWVFLPLVLQ